MLDQACQDHLLRLAVHDDAYIESVLSIRLGDADLSGLDGRTQALVRLGALVALDASTASYQSAAGAAFASGATLEDVVGVLLAVAPVVGVTRAVSAAPGLARGVGYDIDTALERPDVEDARG